MAKGRATRGFKRGPKNNIWTTILGDEVAIGAASSTTFDIVAAADWTVAGGLERATILRVRGWFSAVVKDATGSFAGGAHFAYIGLFDEDETSPGGSISGTYIDEDIMATYGFLFAFADTGTVGQTWSQEIDVKAMRKIRTGQDLRFVYTNSGTTSVEVSLVIRALLRRGGN